MVLVGGELVFVILGREAGLGVGTVGFVNLLPDVSICIVGNVFHVHPGGFSTLQELSLVLRIGLFCGTLGFLEVFVIRPFLVGAGSVL